MNDGATILDLLKVDPPRAWRHLVDAYSSLILAVIGRYNPDPDDRMDAYLYVLQELASNDMRRIRRYGEGSIERPCRFDTWLKLVVRNLYFDWFRHRHGRKSVPKEIQKLSELHQRVFRLIYWEGYAPREAFEVLHSQRAKMSYPAFLECLSEIDLRLTGINRAKIRRDFLRAVGPMSLDADSETRPPLEARATVEQSLPDSSAEAGEKRRALSRVLGSLSAEDRLLIRLRFYEGLTARELATAIGEPDPMVIYRRIERVCKNLAERAESEGVADVLLRGDFAALADSGLPPELAAELPAAAAEVIARKQEGGS